MELSVKFIGIVNSGLKRIEDCPLQENEDAPEATVTIYPEFREGIKDIKAGATIMLLTWLHLADRSVIKCISRNNRDSPVYGVFSTRSPDRPNPIGVHTAKVIAVTGDSLAVSTLEVLDQTPLIDIKPVLRS
jgi:tRNA-Thr(GGU) m(6)t(6)A37 methyltransferase TsaA